MKSSEIVRKLILEAAEKLFAQFGFRKTSIDDIARKAKIGKGSVYLHFPSKEAIFAEIVRSVSDNTFAQLARTVNEASSSTEAVRAFVTVKLTAVAESVARFNFGDDVVAELLPMIDELRVKHVERERTLLYLILQKGAAEGSFAIGDLEKTVSGLMTCLESIERAIFEPHQQANGLRTGIAEVLEIFLRGLQKTP